MGNDPRIGEARCATCKFLAANRDDQQNRFDDAEMYRHGSGWQTCVRVIHGNGDRTPPSDVNGPTIAAVIDGSGYAARLVVRSEFGCVLHEPRTADVKGDTVTGGNT